MTYPIKTSQQVAVGQAMSTSFRPAEAGLVTVTVTCSASLAVPTAVVSLRLDLFPPGATTPAATTTGRKQGLGTGNRVTVWVETPAAASQLGADWKVTVTNLGNLTETVDVTIRYQVVAGNLGKVDHILVLMMENRSFDHMLGYLSLTGGRSDVDGLKGGEFNLDAAGNRVPVAELTTTLFTEDPGHGWTDVAGPLPPAQAGPITVHSETLATVEPVTVHGGTSPPPPPYQLMADHRIPTAVNAPVTAALGTPIIVPPTGLASNAGFVMDFAQVLQWQTPEPPHDQADIAPGAARTIRFQLDKGQFQPGSKSVLGVRSLPMSNPIQSKSGLLGTLTVHNPSGGAPVAAETTVIGAGAVSLNYTPSAADLALTGDWTCTLVNNADATIGFITDISNSVGPNDPADLETAGAIMGYYDKESVPSYDSLARQFVVCDRWFAAIPTDTFPNRLYAMTGGSGGLLTTPSDASVASDPPAYPMKTIFEVLQDHGVDWNMFFSDLPFPLVFTALVRDAQYTSRMLPMSAFLDRAETGDLPAMAWLDPNFNDVPDGTDNASDDHPPGDVARGQQFVAQVFNALAASPAWSKTMLIITYDEHGGFYDHVEPPGTPPRTDGPKDDDPNLTRYGVRVPALVVSPWVAQGEATHTVYDHTSILRTILLRYCVTPIESLPILAVAAKPAIGAGIGIDRPIVLASNVPSMGARTDSANDLGPLLSLDAPRAATPIALAARAAGPTSSPLTGIGATVRLSVLRL